MTSATHPVTQAASNSNSIHVSIVSGIEDFMACMAIRSAAFLARGEPFEEEFDQNDLISTTHLLAKMGRTPVGTMRIRILTVENGGIISWERLAILPSAGNTSPRILMSLARTARAYSEFKGAASVVGAVENPKLLKFWQKHGFKLMDVPPAVYNDREYLQIKLTLKTAEAISVAAPESELIEELNGSIELSKFDQFMTVPRQAA